MPSRFLCFPLLVSLASLPVVAQSTSFNQAAPGTLGVGSASASLSAFPGVDEGQRNEPYTLTQETTTLRTLADGTHITNVRQETRIRDAEGRLRTEITREGQNPFPMHFVHIFDPTNHTWTTLDDRNKQANIHHLPVPEPPTPEQKARLAELRAKAEASRTAPTDQPAVDPQRRRSEVEKLGSRVIAGVSAEGRRVTRTIPAGREGNDRDLTITTETWTSPALHVVLERTTDDPRNGKVTMMTTTLQRGSPDPALFQTPADYKVTEEQPTPIR